MNAVLLFGLVIAGASFFVSSDGTRGNQDLQKTAAKREPTCEELREMWRFTKLERERERDKAAAYRSSKVAVVPVLTEPAFAYGSWKSVTKPRPRAVGYPEEPVYGRVVHSPEEFTYRKNYPSGFRAYNHVARMVGAPSPLYPLPGVFQQKTFFRLDYPLRPSLPYRISHVGRFRELQDLLRKERAQEIHLKGIRDQVKSVDGGKKVGIAGGKVDDAGTSEERPDRIYAGQQFQDFTSSRKHEMFTNPRETYERQPQQTNSATGMVKEGKPEANGADPRIVKTYNVYEDQEQQQQLELFDAHPQVAMAGHAVDIPPAWVFHGW